MKTLKLRADVLGAIASGLCLIHCLATPLIFIAKSCAASCCSAAPDWWKWIDYLFLGIAFFAVYRSVRTTSKKFMKYALWASWGILFLLIINETLGVLELAETFTYIAALVLIALHLYNLKYCQCNKDECCV